MYAIRSYYAITIRNWSFLAALLQVEDTWVRLKQAVHGAATMHLAPSISPQDTHSWLSRQTQDALMDKKQAWIKLMGAPDHLKGVLKAEWSILKNKARHMVARDKRTAWWHKVKALENSFKKHDIHISTSPHVRLHTECWAEGL